MRKPDRKNYSMPLTTEEFVLQLASKYLPDLISAKTDIYLYGRQKGWLEDQDQRFCKNYITRRNAARIIHQFMKNELGVPDIADISPAEVLKDLYTCRVCANHIAQVYLRGIMDAREVEYEGQICLVFEQMGLVEEVPTI